jgi:hypothetical protein
LKHGAFRVSLLFLLSSSLLLGLSPEAPSAATVAAKRISRSAARELLEAITVGARPLLRRIVDTTSQPSVLEEKLLAGGATQAIIDDAKSLRANASIRRLEYFASSISDDTSALDDLRERLRIATNGYVAEHSPGPKAAAVIWNRLRPELLASAASVDPDRIFRQDGHLLLGEVCEMADECLTDWGRGDA